MMKGYKTLQKMYNYTIRNHLPRKYRLLAGVAVQDTPLLDFTADKKYYKYGLMNAVRDGIEKGDKVDLVGFGRGVSTVHAFDAGAHHVTAYEASPKMIKTGRNTVNTNRPFDIDLTIEHKIVGDAIDIYGAPGGAEFEDPGELCNKDALVLDCEGAEKSIIKNLGTYPGKIICETHPEHGISNKEIIEILQVNYQTNVFEYEPNSNKKKVILASSQ